MFDAKDHEFMAEALRLAELGLNTTRPNPRVGCVIVNKGVIVGRGWHRRAGEPHAEILALQKAGGLARHATAYVTLEPCSHQGKTPPCAPELVSAGVDRVVAAVEDPNPLVHGKGLGLLRTAGIQVDCDLLADQARQLNVGFFSRHLRKRPWVRLKIASSLDGGTALANGQSQWITSQQSREDVHRYRARSCAILTGIGTVRADNSRLTVRGMNSDIPAPLRVVLDSNLSIDPKAALLQGGGWVIHAQDPQNRAAALRAAGATLHKVAGVNKQVDLLKTLQLLAQFEINEILVEAGPQLNNAFIMQRLADELLIYLSPKMLGAGARPWIRSAQFTDLEECLGLMIQDITKIGPDLRIRATTGSDNFCPNRF